MSNKINIGEKDLAFHIRILEFGSQFNLLYRDDLIALLPFQQVKI